jgi:hypothetical protein
MVSDVAVHPAVGEGGSAAALAVCSCPAAGRAHATCALGHGEAAEDGVSGVDSQSDLTGEAVHAVDETEHGTSYTVL